MWAQDETQLLSSILLVFDLDDAALLESVEEIQVVLWLLGDPVSKKAFTNSPSTTINAVKTRPNLTLPEKAWL